MLRGQLERFNGFTLYLWLYVGLAAHRLDVHTLKDMKGCTKESHQRASQNSRHLLNLILFRSITLVVHVTISQFRVNLFSLDQTTEVASRASLIGFMSLAALTSLWHMLTLDVVKEVAATLRTPDEGSIKPAVSAAAELQMRYSHKTLSLRPFATKSEQPLVPDSPTKVASISSATEYEQSHMPYAPMKHMLASPDQSEQPRMPYAPMKVLPASPARRYGSTQVPYASIKPDMAPSVYSAEQPRVPYAERNVALGMVVPALSVKQRWVPYPPGSPLK